MPVYLDTPAQPTPGPSRAPWTTEMPRFDVDTHTDACLHIGLVNNMPLAAMRATESQFLSLLHAASDGLCLHVSLYTLPGVRSLCTDTDDLDCYTSLNTLWERSLDGLIVTGAEPVTAHLTDEPYWAILAKLVAWATEHTYAAVWSCLAAHAAVLAQDGIARIRGNTKHSGVFDCTHTGDHPLLHELPATFAVPHSRWNGLDETALVDAGYTILSRAEQIGVDAFVKQYRSLFLFPQGHPEYAADTLLREYRRDMTRYVRGESETAPTLPLHYFDRTSEAQLTRLWDEGRMPRTEASLTALSIILLESPLSDHWRSAGCVLYRNWLRHICLEKMTHLRGSSAAAVFLQYRTQPSKAQSQPRRGLRCSCARRIRHKRSVALKGIALWLQS